MELKKPAPGLIEYCPVEYSPDYQSSHKEDYDRGQAPNDHSTPMKQEVRRMTRSRSIESHKQGVGQEEEEEEVQSEEQVSPNRYRTRSSVKENDLEDQPEDEGGE
jgi:hypothetical protein